MRFAAVRLRVFAATVDILRVACHTQLTLDGKREQRMEAPRTSDCLIRRGWKSSYRYFQAEYTCLPTRYAGFALCLGRNFCTPPRPTAARYKFCS